MSEKRKRHKWGQAKRICRLSTIKTCERCGLNRIDDHDTWPNAIYYRDRSGDLQKPMPQCEEA